MKKIIEKIMIIKIYSSNLEKIVKRSIKNIIRKHKDIKFDIKHKNNLSIMEIEISISIKKHKPESVVISISNKIIEIQGRYTTCLNYWLPSCIEAAYHSGRSLNLKFDTDDYGSSSCLSMDSEDINNLIPDEYSMRNYYKKRYSNNPMTFNKFKNNWLKRKKQMYWRGSTTGGGIITTKNDLFKLKRVIICKSHNRNSLYNMKISKIVQNNIPKKVLINELKKENIWSRSVFENTFSNYCFYPDIPGNALAWGSIRKYLMGNLIFKSSTKRQLYYYRFLQPWKHYIPIEENFVDLEEKYSWIMSHMEQSAFIAWNGYIQANNYIKNTPKYLISRILEGTK